MSDSIRHAIMIAAGIVITCLLVSLAFYELRIVNRWGEDASDETNRIVDELKNSDFTSREGTQMYGSEVANFIRKYSIDSIPVAIVTVSGATTAIVKWYNKVLDASGTGQVYSIAGNTVACNRLAKMTNEAIATQLSNLRTVGSVDYINPSKVYTCYMIYDVNRDNQIIGVAFKE